MNNVKLHIDYCSLKAATFAVMNYHYSKLMPACAKYMLGVWEEEKFIGSIIFSLGANNSIGKPYNLTQQQICELTRVALKKHITSVSKILSISIKMLKKDNAGLRLIVSYADSNQKHIGTIYQAGNWYYVGNAKPAQEYVIHGKQYHGRSMPSKFGNRKREHLIKIDPNYKIVKTEPKYKYLMPLDKDMKKQIEKISLPYPKKQAPEVHRVEQTISDSEAGGANPTQALNNYKATKLN